MCNICYSSELYDLDPRDIIILKDSELPVSADEKDEIIILIGNTDLWDCAKGSKDTLLKGREALERAIAANAEYIPVRIAFISRTAKFDFISPLIRVLRYKYNGYSSNYYHTNPQFIRDMKIERNIRTKENAYKFSNPKYKMTKETRSQYFDNLLKSIQENGFDDKFPIDIMLCRNFGIQDTVNQGHHRMAAALECGLTKISVRFCAAGQAPKLLHPLFKALAKINLLIKK